MESFTPLSPLDQIPLDGSAEDFLNQWYAAILLEDRSRMDLIGKTALLDEQESYSQDYRIRDRFGRIHWLHEEATLLRQSPELWLVSGITTETTKAHQQADLHEMQNQVLRAIATGAALSETLQILCSSIATLFPESPIQILRLDAATQKLFPLIGISVPSVIDDLLADGFPIGPCAGSCGTASYRGEPVFVEDITQSPLWEDLVEVVWGICGMRACWSQPVLSATGEVLGTFALYHQHPSLPDDEAQALLQTAAYLAGVALERHNSEQALRQSQERFQAAVAGSSDALILLDGTTYEILEFNPALERILGVSLERPNLRALAHQLGFTDLDMHKLLQRSLRHVQPIRITLPTGEMRDLELRAAHTQNTYTPLLCLTLHDATERNRSEAITTHILSGAHCLLWYAHIEWLHSDPSRPHMPIHFVNPEAAARFLGYFPEQAGSLQRIWQQGITEEDQRRRLSNLHKALANNQGYSQNFVYLSPHGESRWLHEDIALERLSAGHWRVIGVCTDVTREHQAQEQVYREANYDALTVLPNRKHFIEQLQETLSSISTTDEMAAVLFLDIDRFKHVNDTLGHLIGDQLLALAAQRLRLLAEPQGMVARLGGDEFVVLMKSVADTEAATTLAQELCRVLRQPFQIRSYEFFLSASIGIRLFSRLQDPGMTTETILRQADIAMYRSKESGGDTFELYNSAMEGQAYERLGLEAALYHAVERGELVLHYQPQYPCHGGPVVGVEALVRWQHPEGGLLMPLNFIELAEETGLILEIGEWVLRTSCQQAAAWRAAGLPVCVSVNLSARQLQQRTFPEIVKKALAEVDLPPSFLNLELTETMLVRQTTTVQKVLDELQAMGVRMEVDDFGTGFSSLVTLRRFRMHSLKIDRSFVHGMAEEFEDQVIVQGVIDLAHALGMQVIAEGVETTAQRDLLIEMGCDLVQGYLFGYPMPAENITELLRATAGLAQSRTLLRAA